MKVTYTPAPCEGEGALFSGHVVLNAPAYEERLDLLAQNPEILEVEEGESKGKQSASRLRTMVSMVKWSYGFYDKVDFTRLSDQKKYKSIEDLRYDASCAPLLQDIATKLCSGFDLGN